MIYFFPIKHAGGVVVVILWQLDLQLPMQSVAITTNILSSNPTHGEMCSIKHYVIKCISHLRRFGFSAGTPVSSTNKTDRHDITKQLLKVVLNTITRTLLDTSPI